MKKLLSGGIEKLFSKLEENRILTAVRDGMILAIPWIMAGSFALLLKSLPIPAYKAFLETFLNGFFLNMLLLINDATLGIISLILLLTISLSFEKQTSTENLGLLPLISLCAYIAFAYNIESGFTFEIFQSTWLFNAVVVSIVTCLLYDKLSILFLNTFKSYSEGADNHFNQALAALVPGGMIIFLFALLNNLMVMVFGIPNFQMLVSNYLFGLFQHLGRGLGSALFFVFIMHFLWFFGVHGANMLDDVAKTFFSQGPWIATKTFFDTFIFFGGCGALLCLVVAIFIGERRKSVRELSAIATFPVLFNMNELILFGVPVVFNPIYFIPFILTPLVLTLISYGAFYFGLVPMITSTVEWTSPIFLSGYAATGSIAGSLLQLLNLAVGTLIYLPFVQLSQKQQLKTLTRQIEELSDVVRRAEESGEKPVLLRRTGRLSTVAKGLVSELRRDIRNRSINLYYQPQVNAESRVIGAEALLRWKHPVAGFLYPPLVIALAEEAGLLEELGRVITETACDDLEGLRPLVDDQFMISVNLTASQLDNPKIYEQMKALLDRHSFGPWQLGLELTEQMALSSSQAMTNRLMALHEMGMPLIMDDFGMGHSSLMYLQNNQFDIVKLDGSLVKQLMSNKRSSDIISSIIYLSHSLKFEVLAEFVETAEQRDALLALGCRNYQGYLYSPAIPIDALRLFVQKTD